MGKSMSLETERGLAKKNIGTTYSDVKEQRFGGTRFWTREIDIRRTVGCKDKEQCRK
jgi:hypothetical protein